MFPCISINLAQSCSFKISNIIQSWYGNKSYITGVIQYTINLSHKTTINRPGIVNVPKAARILHHEEGIIDGAPEAPPPAVTLGVLVLLVVVTAALVAAMLRVEATDPAEAETSDARSVLASSGGLLLRLERRAETELASSEDAAMASSPVTWIVVVDVTVEVVTIDCTWIIVQ